ncbi:cytosolic endo-beta-N-acetylglucosaminidase [Colossoma macropomum]|uniref:cytosolic endo-beta-N-acetylglucosaminidase n=1 Tax=Colossoma macropomum TaxID=42526 RepID=UPI001864AADF|nr:cytosolic endo-beta-N-acetylglucosaminidase [Colossoma macropomum]
MMMEGDSVERDGSVVNRRRKREESSEGAGGKTQKRSETDFESCLDDSADVSVHEVITYDPPALPAQHYDPDTTEPISSSLKSLDELLSWKRSEASPFNIATVPLASRQPPLTDALRRTLVCHDMMGGYLEDRFIQGTEVGAPYVFYHWQYIDIFNYFSHHMVTIPPAVWTNAAHKHGVLSLGTFITEWTDGGKMCEVFLAEEEAYRSAADKLVQITHCYGFDGWLINIENVLSATAVKNMAPFLRYLTDQLHERVPGSLVIWYDSVLENGTLKWQNEVNNSNRVFFDACDGIFTNYNWTESSLEGMASYSAAQGRLADIYIGIDVFARGEVVGGMFETNKALQLVRKHGFSTAIFAPGWVYECHDKADFRQNQDKFWFLLADHLYIHRPVSTLPFVSSFCQGFGKSVYWKGQVVQERSWFNLNAQELQPLYSKQSLEDGGWWRTRGCPEDAWAGGSSLLLEGKLPKSLPRIIARIFSLHVPLATRTFISFVYKPSLGVNVSLELKTTDAGLCTYSGTEEIISSRVSPVMLKEDHQLVKQFTQSCGHWTADGWTTRCFQLDLNGCALSEVLVNVDRDGAEQDLDFNCRIGEIMVLDAESLSAPPLPVRSVCVYDVVWQRGAGDGDGSSLKVLLNATLRWSYPPQLVRHWRIHWRRLRGPDPRVPPGPPVLIGRSYSTLYRLVELEVPGAPGLLELLVEPVSREGFTLNQSYWGRITLSYTHSTDNI